MKAQWCVETIGACDEWEVRLDPYLLWAYASDFADLDGCAGDWFPVILELRGKASDFAEQMQANSEWIRVPPLYRFPPADLDGTRFCTAHVRGRFLDALRDSLQGQIVRFELGLPVIASTRGKEARPVISEALSEGKKTTRNNIAGIVGVIDDGFAFAHERFRERGGNTTRIDYFWDQDARLEPDSQVPYGSELTKARIDDLMNKAQAHGVVDEDEVYRQARHPVTRRRIAHGTHVMDLACGLDPNAVTHDSPRMIAVHLPCSTTEDTSGRSLNVHVLDAMRYILKRADDLSGADAAVPVVVNLSYGNMAGPHDGTSMLEQAVDQLVQSRGDSRLAVVLPAGNGRLARGHAHVDLEAGASEELNWRILPDDQTPSFVEVWWQGSHPHVDVQVVAPHGEFSPAGDGTPSMRIWRENGDVLCTIVRLEKAATGDSHMILIAVAPTFALDSARRTAPPGIWKIKLTNQGAQSVAINAWIQRDDAVVGHPRRGRQSRFEDDAYERFDDTGRLENQDNQSFIKRLGTLNGLATGQRTVVIGAYRRSDRAPADYSGTADTKPHALAISDESVGLGGVLAAGTRSNSVVAMSGTSVACAQVTRWLIEEMSGVLRSQASAQEPSRTPRGPSALKRVKDKAVQDDPPKRRRHKPGRLRVSAPRKVPRIEPIV